MARSARRLTERDLAAIIDGQVNDAVLWDAAEAGQSRHRSKALAYFEGDATLGGDVPSPTNRSSVVSHDMSDTHGWIMPSLLRVFLGGDRVVEYEPRRRGAEDAAAQATDYVNYIFRNECSGYAVLYAALWDGLTFGNGIIKHWWDDTPAYETESLTGIPEAKYIELVSDENIEVLEHTERPDPGDPGVAPLASPQPQPEGAGALGVVPPMMPPNGNGMMPGNGAVFDPLGFMSTAYPVPLLHDLKIKRKLYNGCLKIVSVPQEEFRIDRNATALDEDHVRFCAHIAARTRSALLNDFPDKRRIIDELPAGRVSDAGQSQARDQRRDDPDIAADHSTDLIDVWECYIQLDYNGDDVAEWRRVVTAAGANERQILANEEWGGDLPFTDLVPDPMPHRWRGGSLYEEIGDIQRIKTVFWRGINDNLYWINNPQRQAAKNSVDQSSLDELTAPTFGGVVWTTMPNAITDLPIPFVADKLMAGLDLADKVREFRTGVSASTMSLDPEALVNQTATAVNQAATASYSKIETYARNIAEIGMMRLFKCILRLIVHNEDRQRTIRLRGEFVDMDPRGWDADMDVVINVGLGSGSRDRDLMMLQAVAAKQELVVQSLGPMVAAKLGLGPDVVFATYRKMVEAAGIKSPETYFPEVKPEQMQQLSQEMAQQPDPKTAEAQAKMQLEQAKAQAKVQADQEKMAADQQAKEVQMALEWKHKREQADIDNDARAREIEAKSAATLEQLRQQHDLKIAQAQREFELSLREMQVNARLKLQELQMEAALKREEIAIRPQTSPNIQEANP